MRSYAWVLCLLCGLTLKGFAVSETVVLLHGIKPVLPLTKLERALTEAGYNVKNIRYPSTQKTIAANAQYVHAQLEGFVFDVPLHFVTHSMGGLVARSYIDQFQPKNMGKLVQLGPPNQGSEVADFLMKYLPKPFVFFYGPAAAELTTTNVPKFSPPDYSMGIIAGNKSIDPVSSLLLPAPHDGKVSVARTKMDGASHIVLPTTHLFMINNQAVIAQALHFLKMGAFDAE